MLLDPKDDDEEFVKMLAWLLAIIMVMLGGIVYAVIQHYWRG